VDALPRSIRDFVDPIRAANECLNERKDMIVNAAFYSPGDEPERWIHREAVFYRELAIGSQVIFIFSRSVILFNPMLFI